MIGGPFGSKPGDNAGEPGGENAPVPAASGAEAPPVVVRRASGGFTSPQRVPAQSVVVVVPANHFVALDRIAARSPQDADQNAEVIVACAGTPTHATVTAIHAHLRNAQFLLAPAQVDKGDLRALAMSRATGDIVTLIDGVGSSANGAEREAGVSAVMSAPPAVSVIVPVRNGSLMLAEALAAIAASDVAREAYELIVVDDASTDGSLATASRYADTIVRLNGRPRGAAYARNRGADRARGNILVFVDSDVRIRPDTLSRLLATFKDSPLVAAVAASSDGSGDGGVPTQYWNLLHQFAAQTHGGYGIQFEPACGAVLRYAFVEAGKYNEWMFRRPSVEGVDLGQRLHRDGRRVLLRTDVVVSRLKPHSLTGVLATAWRRSALLTRTLSYSGTRPHARADVVHTLNSVKGFAAIATCGLLVWTAFRPSQLLVGLSMAGVATVLWANLRAFRFLARRRGLTFGVAAAPLHVATQMAAASGRCAGWIVRNAIGEPSPDATTQAFAELGVEIWPPVPRKQPSR